MSRQITPDELKKYFPNATKSAIAANADALHSRIGSHPIQKKLQDDNSREREGRQGKQSIGQRRSSKKAGNDNHKSRLSRCHQEDSGEFSITATILYSDNIRRDAINAVETLLDCLCAAGRQLESNSEADNHWEKSSKR